jgi:hypothetical protein
MLHYYRPVVASLVLLLLSAHSWAGNHNAHIDYLEIISRVVIGDKVIRVR